MHEDLLVYIHLYIEKYVWDFKPRTVLVLLKLRAFFHLPIQLYKWNM